MLSTRPARLLLLAGALALPSVHAATARQETAPAAADFKELSGSYPRACSAPVSASLASLGQPSLRQCAWSEHVEMLYWDSVPVPAGGCLTPAALAWHQRARSVTAAVPPWNIAAAGQALLTNPGTAGMQQALAVWRQPDGRWSAVLWRWEPSSRAATRAWQAGHWNDVAGAVRAHVTTGAPAGSSERAQEITKQRAALIERELTALAHAWEASHE